MTAQAIPRTGRTTKNGHGVLVGRFQCDVLTEGHIALIEHASCIHDGRIVIVVGVPKTPTNATNPLSYAIREAMIRQSYPTAIIVPLSDHRSNPTWSRNLDALIQTVTDDGPVVLYSGRDGFIPHYSGRYPTEALNFEIECSATEKREAIAGKPQLSDDKFRQGVIYAHQTRKHQVYEAVDMAVLKHELNGKLSLLLGKKAGEPKWRFPGGFVDPGETFADAAHRELREETTLSAEHGFEILADFLVDDWRVRRQRGVEQRTVLLVTTYAWGPIKGADDLPEVEWFDFTKLVGAKEEYLMEEHHPLFDRLVKYVNDRVFSPVPNPGVGQAPLPEVT